jgi:hypothetical protein
VIQKVSIRRLAGVLIITSVLLGCSGGWAAKQPLLSSKEQPAPLYFGYSIAAGTKVAWLLELDFAQAKGAIYDPPFMRPVVDLKTQSVTGKLHFSFQSPTGVYRFFSFHGTLEGDELCGTLSHVNAEPGQIPSYELCADLVKVNGSPTGRYTSAQQGGEEGGDALVGVDLILLSHNSTREGVITFYGSELDGLTNTPLLFVQVDNKDEITYFETEEAGEKRRFSLLTKGGSLTIRSIDKQGKAVAKEVLHKTYPPIPPQQPITTKSAP